jgi:hypothetical protein
MHKKRKFSADIEENMVFKNDEDGVDIEDSLNLMRLGTRKVESNPR